MAEKIRMCCKIQVLYSMYEVRRYGLGSRQLPWLLVGFTFTLETSNGHSRQCSRTIQIRDLSMEDR